MLYSQQIAVIIPAKDEENAIGLVIKDLLSLHNNDGTSLIDRIIVCDNGSSDKTALVVKDAGAEVVKQESAGYGIACLTALAKLSDQTDIVVFIDGDYSCKAEQAFTLCQAVVDGADMVIGSRKLGFIEPGAMTLAQHFGTGLACLLLRLLYRQPVSDLGPYRAIRKTKLDSLNMQDQRFGWTVEMQAKAFAMKYKIKEVPVDCMRRIGVSKISGTLSGVIGAGKGIIGTIFKIWWQQKSSDLTTTVPHKNRRRALSLKNQPQNVTSAVETRQ